MASAATVKDETIVFDTILDITMVADSFEKLSNYMKEERQQGITLDASQVERIDGAALQMLAALALTLQKDSQQSLKWQGLSDEFKQAAELLGLSKILNYQ